MYRKNQILVSKKTGEVKVIKEVRRVRGSKSVQVFFKGGGVWTTRWLEDFFKLIGLDFLVGRQDDS